MLEAVTTWLGVFVWLELSSTLRVPVCEAVPDEVSVGAPDLLEVGLSVGAELGVADSDPVGVFVTVDVAVGSELGVIVRLAVPAGEAVVL